MVRVVFTNHKGIHAVLVFVAGGCINAVCGDFKIYIVAAIGIIGKDVLREEQKDIYELLDMGYGACHLMMAVPEAKQLPNLTDYAHMRVATKYPHSASEFFEKLGMQMEIVKLNGSIELAPILGLSDVIVDIVETGTTLKENDLTVIEEFMPISARFIANKASYKFKYAQLTELLTKMKEALAQ